MPDVPILRQTPPILDHDDHAAPSLFTAVAMLRESRRRKSLPEGQVPEICVLDPDGDLVAYLQTSGRARQAAYWACFHTALWVWEQDGVGYGVIGCAVGASFSVLLAEQLFASGCRFLIGLSSAGQVADLGPVPYFIAIDRALRDEGTSYHYLPPSDFAAADPTVLARTLPALQRSGLPVHVGATWTTDAPFRETPRVVAARRGAGLLAVEMEAAALYAFGAAHRQPILCLAQVTNRLICDAGDFEKGESEGARAALFLIIAAAEAWLCGETQEAPKRRSDPASCAAAD